MIYLQRILKMNKDRLTLTYKNLKMLLLISLVMAAKFNEDRFEKRTLFSFAGGVSKAQFKKAFITYLDLIDFNLLVDTEEFNTIKSDIKKQVAKKYASKGLIVTTKESIKNTKVNETEKKRNSLLERQNSATVKN